MGHHRGIGWLAAVAAACLASSAWAQDPSGDCIANGGQHGVLYQGLVDGLARDIEAPRKAGDHDKVLKIAAQAQDTKLCNLPPAITIAQAEAFVAVEQVCDAAQPLEQFFAAAAPGDKDYARAEDLYDSVREARDGGQCIKPVGGVALAAPRAEAALSHDDVRPAADGTVDDGSQRDGYRGGELNEGRLAFDSGNYGRAAELFSAVIEQAPDSFEGYARRAQANAKLGRIDAATADYAKAVALAPTRGYLVADFARFLMTANRLQDALVLYDGYMERYPTDLQVLKERAGARLKAGLLDLALEDYGKAIELAPGNTQVRLLRAFLYHDNGRFQDAVADYTAAIQYGSISADVRYRRGIAYYALGRTDEAIADLDAAIAASPSLAAAYTARGALYQLKGDGAAAIRDFSEAVDLRPENAEVYLDRGKEYQRQANAAAAINDYSSVLRFDPGNLEALKSRAMLYQQQGNYANALDDLTQIINRDYVDGDAYARRGWLYYAWKDYKRAMDDFDKALVIDPRGTQAQLGRQAVLEAVAAQEKAAAEAAKRR